MSAQESTDSTSAAATTPSKLLSVCLVMMMYPLLSSGVSAAVKWSCGDWSKDSSGKCEEVRVCTRTVCDTKGQTVSNCRNETRTDCSNPRSSASTQSRDMEEEEIQAVTVTGGDAAPKMATTSYWPSVELQYHTVARLRTCSAFEDLHELLLQAGQGEVSPELANSFGLRVTGPITERRLARHVYAKAKRIVGDCDEAKDSTSTKAVPTLPRPSGAEGKYGYSIQFEQAIPKTLEFTMNGRKRLCVEGAYRCIWYSADSSPSVRGCKKMRSRVGGLTVFSYGHDKKSISKSSVQKCNK